jgi:NAD(P)-dependent dehydrogenase (short-subunit alcohol dehydrogenase family)
VTGASRGIGRATALALAEAGAHVLVHYGRSVKEAESLVAEIQTKGGHATATSADLGTREGAALLAKQVRSIVGDRLDVLVLNAGISKSARIADYTVEDFDNSLRQTSAVRSSWYSNCCRILVRAQASLLSLLLEPVRLWAGPVWTTLRFLLMPLPRGT